MPDQIISSLTPSSLRDILQQAGYRVEIGAAHDGTPHLRSATGGIPFEVRFGNRLGNDAAQADKTAGEPGYGDVTFFVTLQVQGELALELVNRWNNEKRFSRLHLNQGFLIFDMDVSALAGVTRPHIFAQVQIWDSLIQDFIPWLRTSLRDVANTVDAAGNAGAVELPESAGQSAGDVDASSVESKGTKGAAA